jgi:hypothetical protein
MAADATVEWGDDERRVRLIDRLFGDPATSPVRLVGLPALACGAIAVALFTVAEALPWITLRSVNDPDGPTSSAAVAVREFSIEGVADGAVIAYYVAVVLLCMVTAAALVSRPHARRVLSAAGFGLVASLLIVIVGLIGKAGRGGDLAPFYDVDATVESGPYFAIAAVVAAAAALALSGWHPRRSIGRRKPDADAAAGGDADVEPGPIDLTVSSG